MMKRRSSSPNCKNKHQSCKAHLTRTGTFQSGVHWFSTLMMYRDRVNKVVTEVEEAIRSVQDAEDSWRGEMREIRGEVESVRELVPRVSVLSHIFRAVLLIKVQMIEKHSASQSSALTELQSELKSLKTLLLSRQTMPQQPTATGSMSPNGTSSSTTSAANALLSGGKASGGRSIPAWQLAPSKSDAGSGSEAGASLSGSGILEDTDTNKGKDKEGAA